MPEGGKVALRSNDGEGKDADSVVVTDGGFNRFLAGRVRLIGSAVDRKLVMLSGVCLLYTSNNVLYAAL